MRKRKGVSLVEFMLFTFLALLILGAIWHVMRRGMSMQDATAKSIDMMVQARNSLEYFARDVRLAISFMPPVDSSKKEFVIIQDALDVHVNRLKLNRWKDNAYPFYDHNSDNRQFMPAIRVRYIFDEEKRTFTRIREMGVYAIGDNSQARGIVGIHEFRASGEKKEKVLATDMVRFDTETITIDRRGRPRLTSTLTPNDFYLDSWPGNEEQIKIAQTAMVFVHLTTRFDKGLYGLDPDNPQGPKDRKAEEVDIVTKIICHKKAIDTSEREWFSSADDDMRY